MNVLATIWVRMLAMIHGREYDGDGCNVVD